MTTTTYNSGSGNFTVPPGVTSLQIELWGGGAGGGQGNGSSAGAGGGGGGAYCKKNALVVTPGQLVAYSVGTGGLGASLDDGGIGDNGVESTASSSPQYRAGEGYSLGQPTSGGDGGTASNGDTNTAGSDGVNPSGVNGGAGGAAGGAGGGAGGAGATNGVNDGLGVAGTAPGGGGGGGAAFGAPDDGGRGGAGAAGRIVFTYTASSGNRRRRVLMTG